MNPRKRKPSGPITPKEIVALRFLRRRGTVRLLPGVPIATLSEGLEMLERRGLAVRDRGAGLVDVWRERVIEPAPPAPPRLRVVRGGRADGEGDGKASTKASTKAQAGSPANAHEAEGHGVPNGVPNGARYDVTDAVTTAGTHPVTTDEQPSGTTRAAPNRLGDPSSDRSDDRGATGPNCRGAR